VGGWGGDRRVGGWGGDRRGGVGGSCEMLKKRPGHRLHVGCAVSSSLSPSSPSTRPRSRSLTSRTNLRAKSVQRGVRTGGTSGTPGGAGARERDQAQPRAAARGESCSSRSSSGRAASRAAEGSQLSSEARWRSMRSPEMSWCQYVAGCEPGELFFFREKKVSFLSFFSVRLALKKPQNEKKTRKLEKRKKLTAARPVDRHGTTHAVRLALEPQGRERRGEVVLVGVAPGRERK